jgi:hypothetical protein
VVNRVHVQPESKKYCWQQHAIKGNQTFNMPHADDLGLPEYGRQDGIDATLDKVFDKSDVEAAEVTGRLDISIRVATSQTFLNIAASRWPVDQNNSGPIPISNFQKPSRDFD